VKEQTRAQGSKSQVRQTHRDKQGERKRRPTGKGLQCKAGMRAKGKNPLPREKLVTHLDRTTPYVHVGASARVGRPSDTLIIFNVCFILNIKCVFVISIANT
jgi:hypothetical protein